MIEYAEADARATMTVRYNGPRYDALSCGDELSQSLLRGIAKDISYEAITDESFTNCLTLVFDDIR